MAKSLLLIGVLLLFIGCQKQDLSEEVAFYSLKQFDKDGVFAINETTVELGNEILIDYDDIMSYDPRNHSFTISEALAREMDIDVNSTGYFQKPFAVCIGRKIIYTGYFWSALSSLAPDWTTAIPFGNELHISLGFVNRADDPRNDHRILEIFRRDGKLVQ